MGSVQWISLPFKTLPAITKPLTAFCGCLSDDIRYYYLALCQPQLQWSMQLSTSPLNFCSHTAFLALNIGILNWILEYCCTFINRQNKIMKTLTYHIKGLSKSHDQEHLWIFIPIASPMLLLHVQPVGTTVSIIPGSSHAEYWSKNESTWDLNRTQTN